MKKTVKRLGICLAAAALLWTVTLLRDRQTLDRELIRLHVVADSDSPRDQAVKLQVRDAILQSIGKDLQQVADVEEARAYLQKNLKKLEGLANETLHALGCEEKAAVTLCREAFTARVYDTFTLPAGLYEALRVTIGSGQGHNWWCVAFPTLCVPAVSRPVEAVAADAGFSTSLTGAITGEKAYAVRFYLLDLLGSLRAGPAA